MADKDHVAEPKEEPRHEGKNENVNIPPQKSQNSRPKPSVCRRLDFGSCEDESKDPFCFLEELELQRQRGIEKWNFDFENEVPLQGNWEWKKVPAQHTETKEVVHSMEKKNSENRTV